MHPTSPALSRILHLLALGLLALAAACNSGSSGARSHSIGGTLSGLSGGSIVLSLNGVESVTLSANGAFVFATRLLSGASYTVSVVTPPAGCVAQVSNGSGIVSADVVGIGIAIDVIAYGIGGVVSGLDGTLVLQNSGGDDLTISADGPFEVPTRLADGTPFSVSILSSPSGQDCSLGGTISGVILGADVTDLSVVCVDLLSVGGTVSGLSGSLVLQNNGGDDLTVTQDGPFTFPTRLRDGLAYAVTVKSGTTTQRRTLGNATGQLAGAPVSGITVDCADKAWTHPQSEADARSGPGHAVTGLSVAMAAHGDALVTWLLHDGTEWNTQMGERRAGSWTWNSGPGGGIEPSGGHLTEVPSIAIAADGDSLIVYPYYDGTRTRLYLSERVDGTWTHAASLAAAVSPATLDVYSPRVALSANGDAVIAYAGLESSTWHVYVSERRNGVWTHTQSAGDHIDPAGLGVELVGVAMDDDGGTVVAWKHYDGSQNRLMFSEWTGGSWSHPASAADAINPPGSAQSVHLAMNGSGDAILAWTQVDGSITRVLRSERRAGAWAHPATTAEGVNALGLGHTYGPRACIAANGDAAIAWYEHDGSASRAMCSEYRNGTWTHPSGVGDALSPAGGNVFETIAAMSDNGDLVVVWRQYDGSTYAIFKAERRDGVLSRPSALNDSISLPGSHTWSPNVAMDGEGNAVIGWIANVASTDRVFTSEYR
ncbi:MAG: hypothetical protein IT457_06380 [Planctomycetes bacterium]|nr:hypothetical protein [Planctomycetota bacterium]